MTLDVTKSCVLSPVLHSAPSVPPGRHSVLTALLPFVLSNEQRPVGLSHGSLSLSQLIAAPWGAPGVSGHPLFHLIPLKSLGGNVHRSNRALGTSLCSGKNSLYEEINMHLQLLLNRELKKSVFMHMVMFSVKSSCAYGPGFVCLLEEDLTEADENCVQVRSAS